MSVKDTVLHELEFQKGCFISGEQLASKLSVSRAAVWKAIKVLQTEGYVIDAVNHKGYRLSMDSDILSSSGIKSYMRSAASSIDIHIMRKVESTNAYVKSVAEMDAPEGYFLIAESQTAGRGRNNRVFFSPPKTGLYFSILLRPEHWEADQAVQITTMAAAALCLTIEEVSGKIPQIKWVNDIFIDGKKVAGILTEGSFSMETGTLQYAVLGIGMNIYFPEEGFPESITNLAGAIFDNKKEPSRNKIVGIFLDHFINLYHQPSLNSHNEIYRKYSMVIGKDVLILRQSKQIKAHVRQIDDQCRLLVSYEDGQSDVLSYGEIKLIVP